MWINDSKMKSSNYANGQTNIMSTHTQFLNAILFNVTLNRVNRGGGTGSQQHGRALGEAVQGRSSTGERYGRRYRVAAAQASVNDPSSAQVRG